MLVERLVPASEHKTIGSLLPATIKLKQGRSSEAIDDKTLRTVWKECGPERPWKQEMDGSITTVTL